MEAAYREEQSGRRPAGAGGRGGEDEEVARRRESREGDGRSGERRTLRRWEGSVNVNEGAETNALLLPEGPRPSSSLDPLLPPTLSSSSGGKLARSPSILTDDFGSGKRNDAPSCGGGWRPSIGTRRYFGAGHGELVMLAMLRLVERLLGANELVVGSLEERRSCSDEADVVDCSEMGRARWLGRFVGN